MGGVKVGHEAGIGYNAYYYPDGNRYLEQWPDDAGHDPNHGLDASKGMSGGLAQLGYAAVKTAGIKTEGELTRDDIGQAIQQYLAWQARAVVECGIPRGKVFTHGGGNAAPPWDKHMPFWGAINEWSTPGWSFYGRDPHGIAELSRDLAAAKRDRWAAVEWWWGANDLVGWRHNIESTLNYRDCRFISVYNWNCGFKFKEHPKGHEALRQIVGDW